MPFQITRSGTGDVVPVPSGTYTATLESVSEKPGGVNGAPFRIWSFLADVEGQVLPVEGVSSTNNGTRTKTYEWLTAIIGREPSVGETVEDPIGQKCRVTVIQKDGYPRVDGVFPFTAPEMTLDGIPR